MRAILHSPDTDHLAFGDIAAPRPAAHEALIEVRAASLNYLDIAYRSANLEAGEVPGVDAAGVVVEAAADGSGPTVGQRVATFGGGGAWAQLRAVSASDVAVIPDGVSFEAACALPGAGVTALQSVVLLGSLLGRRILVTGASGGVGRFAVQLAALAGADVVAAVGSLARGAGLLDLGAAEVVVLTDVVGPFDHAIDMVGGEHLSRVVASVSHGGRVLAVGSAAGTSSSLDLEAERRRGGGTWLSPFTVQAPFGPDLESLLDLVSREVLDPQIGWSGSWEHVNDAAELLRSRRLMGKAILQLD